MRIKTKEELLALPSFSTGILIDNDRNSFPVAFTGKEVIVTEDPVYEGKLRGLFNAGPEHAFYYSVKKEWVNES